MHLLDHSAKSGLNATLSPDDCQILLDAYERITLRYGQRMTPAMKKIVDGISQCALRSIDDLLNFYVDEEDL